RGGAALEPARPGPGPGQDDATTQQRPHRQERSGGEAPDRGGRESGLEPAAECGQPLADAGPGEWRDHDITYAPASPLVSRCTTGLVFRRSSPCSASCAVTGVAPATHRGLSEPDTASGTPEEVPCAHHRR